MERDTPSISDYGIIGNLNTVALVSKKGSIDFFSVPRADSPTIFTALLDHENGGYFDVIPEENDINYKQMYLPSSTILLTRFLSKDGVAELIDFMPVAEDESKITLVRHLRIIRGKINFNIRCRPIFDYARKVPAINQQEDGLFNITGKNDSWDLNLFLRAEGLELKKDGDTITSAVSLKEGKEIKLVITTDKGLANCESLSDSVDSLFKETTSYWRNWLNKSNYTGRWREDVHRSAMTLKLLTSERYGSIMAAATFGIPESEGNKRNWDYRFSWIRDSAFSMYAFLRLGFMNEADNFFNWLKECCDLDPLQLMYGIDGRKKLDEEILDHLSGYHGTKPVRIGNNAYKQTQMDIYGELIDTVYLYDRYGGLISHDFWQVLEKLVDNVCENWRKKDHGIWEVRTDKKEFLHSKIMCWVALDRALKIVDNHSFPAPVNRWRETRDTIFNDIYENYWSEEKGAFVQFRGGNAIDASVLLMPLVHLISPNDPKWKRTMKTLEKELVTDPLVYRYRIINKLTDGFPSKEATFSICSFWYVECLARTGEVEKARLNFEKMLGYANHLGLFSEQIGIHGEQLGNFPQAFTHLALISSAYELDKHE